MKNIVLALVLVGCAGVPDKIEEKDLPAVAARVLCDRERECAYSSWLVGYFGQADCHAHWEREIRFQIELADDLDCDYDADEAGKAYTDLNEMDCEDWHQVMTGDDDDPREDVWTECVFFGS